MYSRIFLTRLELLACIVSLTFPNEGYCDSLEIKKETHHLELSEYVTIVITVPETHTDAVREAIGRAGAGKVGDYSYCSYSVKGIGRFMPNKGATPYLGKEGILEEVVEGRIETVCSLGRKKAKGSHS